jgi:hypothetical protein
MSAQVSVCLKICGRALKPEFYALEWTGLPHAILPELILKDRTVVNIRNDDNFQAYEDPYSSSRIQIKLCLVRDYERLEHFRDRI